MRVDQNWSAVTAPERTASEKVVESSWSAFRRDFWSSRSVSSLALLQSVSLPASFAAVAPEAAVEEAAVVVGPAEAEEGVAVPELVLKVWIAVVNASFMTSASMRAEEAEVNVKT